MAFPKRIAFLFTALCLCVISVLVFKWKDERFTPSLFGIHHNPPETHLATTSPASTQDLIDPADRLLYREKLLEEKENRLNAEVQKLEALRTEIVQHKQLEKLVSSIPKSLISYVYVESPTNRRNLIFFIQHGLYHSADFVFTFNGETNAHELLPSHPLSPYYNASITNIETIHRNNTGLDFGAHGETFLREWNEDETVLTPMGKADHGGKKFWQSYDRFILMNASVRGPFLPYWSQDCWSEAFWRKITDLVKLVGMSYNCHSGKGHVQSMVWALDRKGVEIIMQHPPAGVGYWSPIDMVDAIYGETRTTPTILKAGYQVDVMTSVYHSREGDDVDGDGVADGKPDNYLKDCKTDDFFHENAYHGFNIHPYETIFMKAARHIQENLLGNLTEWTDGQGYDSRRYCDLP